MLSEKTPIKYYLRPLIALFLAMTLAACSTSETLDVTKITASRVQEAKYAAIVIDANDGRVLFSDSENAPRYPASLTKMMTLYLVFDALKSGRITTSTLLPVSENAARQPASKLYLKAGSTIDVDTAIRALAVKSANDVATAVAENLGGTEEGFARMMTAKARQLGMRSTVFTNASGLPDERMRTTARDMALLAVALRRNHSAYYGYFALRSFTYNGKTITGHNRVLDKLAGADGLKTGYIRASGYNLATSMRKDGRSLVGVVMGGASGSARDALMVDLLNANLRKARRR